MGDSLLHSNSATFYHRVAEIFYSIDIISRAIFKYTMP